jgi:hypothetical protein
MEDAPTVRGGANRERTLFAWGNLITLAILAGYFFAFNEWLFLVTKPSFMDLLPLGAKLGILLLSGLLLAVFILLALLPLFALSLLPWRDRPAKIFLWIGAVLPGFILAATILLLVDNFTYTVFRFGIVTTQGLLRGLYAALFVLLLAACTRWVMRSLSRPRRKERMRSTLKLQACACAALLLLSVSLGSSLYSGSEIRSASAGESLPDTGAAGRPNILLFGSDGINAERLSLYGYEVETSPFLTEFAQEALVSENNFPNANITTGSLASLYTGKLPTETRTLFPPDILKGEDAAQHLPGILKQEGYYTAQLSVDYYGDANTVNLQNGFVMVNGRSAAAGGLYSFFRRYVPEEAAYFLSTSAKRLSDRLAHLFFLSTMTNPFTQVTQKGLDSSSDPERMRQLFYIIEDVEEPWFVHVHLMGTHQYLYDDYDEAVLNFDRYLLRAVRKLEQAGKLDETLVIVYSDHGRNNERLVRTPLVVRFPGGEYAQTLTHNTQNLDLAPTILDYLGLEPPAWMGGHSLLSGEPPVDRPVFSVAPNYRKDNGQGRLELDLGKIKPPFYQFGTIDMIICHRAYSVDTTELTWKETNIHGYPRRCSPETLPGERQAQGRLLEQLREHGFDVSRLKAALERESSRP